MSDDSDTEEASEGSAHVAAQPAISVRIDDLAFAAGSAIAWPVNANLTPTTPLLRRLEVAGGKGLAAQLRAQDPFPVGSAVVTGAGDLSVELLVSAVIVSDSEQVTTSSVRRALTSALQRAADWQIENLLLAPFGLGAGNLDVDESADLTIDVLTRHMSHTRFPASVTIVVENDLERDAFAAALTRSKQ